MAGRIMHKLDAPLFALFAVSCYDAKGSSDAQRRIFKDER